MAIELQQNECDNLTHREMRQPVTLETTMTRKQIHQAPPSTDTLSQLIKAQEEKVTAEICKLESLKRKLAESTCVFKVGDAVTYKYGMHRLVGIVEQVHYSWLPDRFDLVVKRCDKNGVLKTRDAFGGKEYMIDRLCTDYNQVAFANCESFYNKKALNITERKA